MPDTIYYSEGYKYQLRRSYTVKTPIVGYDVVEEFFMLSPDGTLHIKSGYAWDGASGPTFDTKSSMRPSLVHDVFCQMMRAGQVDYSVWQDKINELFRQHCIEDGMWHWRAGLWHTGVEVGDAGNPDQGPDREILEAP